MKQLLKQQLMLLLLLSLTSLGFAHKLAPSLLEISEKSAGLYSVLWRTPALSGQVSPEPIFPQNCTLDAPESGAAGTSIEWRWTMQCPQGLTGQTLQVRGLTASRTAALLTLTLADDRQYSELIRRDGQLFTVPAVPGTWRVVGQYFALGVEHILNGFDHLLFVTGLLLLASGWRQLLMTVTAFTLGHSITLVCVSLGIIPPISLWVELAIAATILYLALELSYKSLADRALRMRWPVIAAFGLIHGLGFASVLTELGLPQNDIVAGLVSFNVGIEVGQVVFVIALVAMTSLMRRLSASAAPLARGAAVYLMGGMAVFWCLDRGYAMLLSSFYFF